jgi:hypothetical protein
MKKLRGDKPIMSLSDRKRISKLYTGSGNPMYGKKSWCSGKKRPEISGVNHPFWSGGYWIDVYGYKVIENSTINNGVRIKEHRYVMENFLKRKLRKSELIHHINGDKLDNRIENLQIVSRKKHPTIHKLTRAIYGNGKPASIVGQSY